MRQPSTKPLPQIPIDKNCAITLRSRNLYLKFPLTGTCYHALAIDCPVAISLNLSYVPNPGHIPLLRCRKRQEEKQIFRFPPLSKLKAVDTAGAAWTEEAEAGGGGNQKNCRLSAVTSCDSQ